MLAFLRKIFSSPIFEQDDDKTRSAAILNPILLGTIVLLGFLTIIQGFTGARTYLSVTTAVLAILALVSVGLWFLMKRGYVRQAGYVYITIGWVALTIQAWTYSGLRDIAIVAYIVVILASGLLIGLRTSIGYAALSIIANWVFAYLETIGKYNRLGDSPYPTAVELTIIFVLVAFISYLAVNHINQSLRKSRSSEQGLRINNQELQRLQADLEKRVEEHTTNLERRTAEIQTAAQITRVAATAKNIDVLFNRTIQLVQSKFGYYHIGLFLIDDNGEYAVLKAAGGETGKLMLVSKYKLRVGEQGIISNVARTGESRIALDENTETTPLQNPLLPYTRSEMALPLKIEDRIVGVLDIQSDKVNAFDQNSISFMQIVTDQISVAIERINLLQESQQKTVELERALHESTSRTWQTFLQQTRKRSGYRYDGITVESLPELPQDSREIMQKNESVVIQKSEAGKTSSVLAVPIRLREQSLGTLNLQFQGKEISQEILRLVEESANRLALSLENARLVAEAQQRAERERTLGQVTARMRETLDIDTVLRTAVHEIKQTLNLDQAEVRLQLTDQTEKTNRQRKS